MKTTRVLAIMDITFCLASSAAADWVTSGNNMYSGVSGNVGIGTNNPVTKLDVNGTLKLADTMYFSNSAGATNWQMRNDGAGMGPSWFGSFNAQNYDARISLTDYISPAPNKRSLFLVQGANTETDLVIDGSLGTYGTLFVGAAGNWQMTNNGAGTGPSWFGYFSRDNYDARMALTDSISPAPNKKSVLLVQGANTNTDLIVDGRLGLFGNLVVEASGKVLFADVSTGKVGIGTNTPAAKLDVNGMLAVTGGSDFVLKGAAADAGDVIFQTSTGAQKGRIWSDSTAEAGTSGLYLSSGDNTADISIFGDGSVAIRRILSILSAETGQTVLTLGEGLDYAEGFDVAETEETGPGSVLVIDPANPGKLAMSTTPYDTKVAGIVAGAKSLGSGVRLGTGQFDQDVALAGRVYCNVDATEAAIQPGDLLTTSATPGYAMKASDHVRALGAILGKAMEPLDHGKKGQILVLVALQ